MSRRGIWIGMLWGMLVACGGSRSLDRGAFTCQKPATIAVTVLGLRSMQGEVRMALFDTAQGFPGEPGLALQRGIATMVDSTATYTFAPVACGSYAVSVFHDEDGNGEMRTDFLGRPQEGWGVSRDARGRFGPPDFEDAVFVAKDESVSVTLHLEY